MPHREKVTGASAPKVAERCPSWGVLAKLRGWADSRDEEGTQVGGNLVVDSVPPGQTGSPRGFDAFWRCLGQVGWGEVWVKEHGAVQGMLG